MRVVITGHKGQLGQQLQSAFARHELLGIDVPEHDISAYPAIVETIISYSPDLVIHAAAYTNVDGCARDPELAYRVNGLGTQNIALACQRCQAPLVYISTNEVFDGTASEPYVETDATHAINPYGRSKLMGETYVRALLSRYYIVRIAWLFSPSGNNFPSKITALARQRGALAVVTDEVSSPTYAPDLVAALARLVESERYGIYHLVNEGWCSRYDFTRAILAGAGLGHVPVSPILSQDYQRPSKPPLYTPLYNLAASQALGIKLRPWQEALADFQSRGG
ncbi:MAG: dTDP-4-dehydrorhamnose reductase [Anaerolineae bacterium]